MRIVKCLVWSLVLITVALTEGFCSQETEETPAREIRVFILYRSYDDPSVSFTPTGGNPIVFMYKETVTLTASETVDFESLGPEISCQFIEWTINTEIYSDRKIDYRLLYEDECLEEIYAVAWYSCNEVSEESEPARRETDCIDKPCNFITVHGINATQGSFVRFRYHRPLLTGMHKEDFEDYSILNVGRFDKPGIAETELCSLFPCYIPVDEPNKTLVYVELKREFVDTYSFLGKDLTSTYTFREMKFDGLLQGVGVNRLLLNPQYLQSDHDIRAYYDHTITPCGVDQMTFKPGEPDRIPLCELVTFSSVAPDICSECNISPVAMCVYDVRFKNLEHVNVSVVNDKGTVIKRATDQTDTGERVLTLTPEIIERAGGLDKMWLSLEPIKGRRVHYNAMPIMTVEARELSDIR